MTFNNWLGPSLWHNAEGQDLGCQSFQRLCHMVYFLETCLAKPLFTHKLKSNTYLFLSYYVLKKQQPFYHVYYHLNGSTPKSSNFMGFFHYKPIIFTSMYGQKTWQGIYFSPTRRAPQFCVYTPMKCFHYSSLHRRNQPSLVHLVCQLRDFGKQLAIHTHRIHVCHIWQHWPSIYPKC